MLRKTFLDRDYWLKVLITFIWLDVQSRIWDLPIFPQSPLKAFDHVTYYVPNYVPLPEGGLHLQTWAVLLVVKAIFSVLLPLFWGWIYRADNGD